MNFPEKVRTLVRAIPAGKIVTYGYVAALLDNPRAARAVGYAMQNLPVGTDVPWHRVVGKAGKRGKITVPTYVAEEQFRRLQAEGIQFDADQQFPLLDYLWQPSGIEVLAILGE